MKNIDSTNEIPGKQPKSKPRKKNEENLVVIDLGKRKGKCRPLKEVVAETPKPTEPAADPESFQGGANPGAISRLVNDLSVELMDQKFAYCPAVRKKMEELSTTLFEFIKMFEWGQGERR